MSRDARRPPLWSEDVSIHAGEERYVTRRQLAKFLGLTSLGMFVGNLWILGKSWTRRTPRHPQVPVASVDELQVGGVKQFSYPGADDPCILIRTGEESWVAYGQKCTHLSCAVIYRADRGRIECPCHNGVFAVEDGRVLAGPPPRPLARVELERRGNEVVALRVIQRHAVGGDES